MNSKEIVQRTLDYNGPDRVARSFGDSDLAFCEYNVQTYATEWMKVDEKWWHKKDEWGNLWGRCDETSKGEVIKGILHSLDDIDSYQLPDFSRPDDYKDVTAAKGQYPDKWIVGNMPGFTFNIARKLFKLDTYLMNLVLETERIGKLHDQIDVQLENMIRNYAKAGVDCVLFPEDWGTQLQTLISPNLWRQEFSPRTTQLCQIAHENGIKVFMHSCGAIGAIVPSLIEAGIDVLQFDQPTLHGLDVLAGYQQDSKITFWCPVDVQKILPTGNETQIRDQAMLMLEKLWKGRGGFIAGFYKDVASLGVEPEWQEDACDEFMQKGMRSNYQQPV